MIKFTKTLQSNQFNCRPSNVTLLTQYHGDHGCTDIITSEVSISYRDAVLRMVSCCFIVKTLSTSLRKSAEITRVGGCSSTSIYFQESNQQMHFSLFLSSGFSCEGHIGATSNQKVNELEAWNHGDKIDKPNCITRVAVHAWSWAIYNFCPYML